MIHNLFYQLQVLKKKEKDYTLPKPAKLTYLNYIKLSF